MAGLFRTLDDKLNKIHIKKTVTHRQRFNEFNKREIDDGGIIPENLEGRRRITRILTEAAIDFWAVKCKFGVYKEVGVIKWGKLRCDLLCIHQSGKIVGIEVKSCKQDFDTDMKMQNYLPYLDRLYIVCPKPLVKYVKSKLRERIWGDKIGIYTLEDDGYLRCKKKGVELNTLSLEERNRLLCKLAWRAAEYSKKTRKKRTRRSLEN